MKSWLAISLLLVILLPELTKVWIVFDFKINQDYIAEVLCINKDEPESGCNGKCHLAKQLKKAEGNDQENKPNKINPKLETVFFLIKSTQLLNSPYRTLAYNLQLGYLNTLFPSPHHSRLFRPPQMVNA